MATTPITSTRPAARARSALPRRLRVEVPEALGDARRAQGIAAALQALPGVTSATVNPITGRALLRFESDIQDLDAALAAVAHAAATAQPADAPAPRRRPAGEASDDHSGAVSALATPSGPQPIGRDWLRVIAGSATVAGLVAIRIFGGA